MKTIIYLLQIFAIGGLVFAANVRVTELYDHNVIMGDSLARMREVLKSTDKTDTKELDEVKKNLAEAQLAIEDQKQQIAEKEKKLKKIQKALNKASGSGPVRPAIELPNVILDSSYPSKPIELRLNLKKDEFPESTYYFEMSLLNKSGDSLSVTNISYLPHETQNLIKLSVLPGYSPSIKEGESLHIQIRVYEFHVEQLVRSAKFNIRGTFITLSTTDAKGKQQELIFSIIPEAN